MINWQELWRERRAAYLEIRDGDSNNLTWAIRKRIFGQSASATAAGSALIEGREEEHGTRTIVGAREAAGAETVHR